MSFHFQSGQRPLEGYTLKRGIGQGGFGEVYYAVSDGGKEVALKLVRDNLDIELRGVAHCLNLKHPNLVNLYDLKKDAQGNQWVVMEYVSGESLTAVLERHPHGLAPELAQQWFLAFSRAVSCLHDHGIVHRDLKPGNIFLENGIIKVGDYGLSKYISGSHQEAQTQSVGTVHYMAPEIGSGNYNKQIDIYAAGIIFYEMLSGNVPFDGESTNEILMKHLTTKPDLNAVPAECRPILARALDKDPQKRYASMADMARDVEALAGGKPPEAKPHMVKPRVFQPIAAVPEVLPADTLGHKVGELSSSMALTALVASLSLIVWTAIRQVEPNQNSTDWTELGSLYFQTVLICWAALVPGKFWSSRCRNSWPRRFTLACLGVLVGAITLYLDGWVVRAPLSATLFAADGPARRGALPTGADLSEAAGVLSYFGLSFFILRWWRLTDPRRSARFRFLPLLATTFVGCMLVELLRGEQQWLGPVALVLASAIVQLVSPWEPPPVTAVARRVRLRFAR
jgi:serine/threonine protein kinase